MGTIPILGVSVWFIAKIFVLIALIIYIVFAWVIVRQVKLMTQTLEVGFEIPLRILAFAHLIFGVVVFLVALIIL